MKQFIKGFNFLELSLDERVLLAHELLASVRYELDALPLTPDTRAAIVERLGELGAEQIAP